ncbi:C40 family peptidase [Streptomyces sp. DSM 41972]|uniref:C40 family peptidase n=1 Tax=Streptomyces althioticus subsp. attaecolombicae TaxID=3075534 RepID=A0ABU3HXK2_9ACTN|nr:C40 family peptidase [Streptomyces sp. DSM 41972]SCD64668.1 NlpC/P60 family protein [Streptomyces sp. di50b]SCD70369.1 NlpC/P60 family protein [Streptomyces sp. di188]
MNKTTKGIVGLFAAGSMLLVVPVLAFGAGTASASCPTGGAQSVDTAAVADQVKAILAGGGTASVSVPGLDNPAEQIPFAKTIQATGVAMNIPARGQVVALATALQESGLRNLTWGDRDSLGLFQQRPSMGWGTANEILDPVHASTKFYEGLRQVSGWQSLSVTQAAQAVQRSGFPEAYAKWESLATALQKAIEPLLPKTGGGGGGASPSPVPDGPAPGATGGCAADGDGTDFGTIPAGALPKEYSIPATAPREVQTAIRWALGQLGTPYQWGGTCTDSHGDTAMRRCDCSSLMQQAYKAAGVTLTRTTYTQVKEGKPVSADALRPGDLIFTEGTAAVPEHVGMAIGQGLVVHAPRTGDVVRITTVAAWKSGILAVRRVV